MCCFAWSLEWNGLPVSTFNYIYIHDTMTRLPDVFRKSHLKSAKTAWSAKDQPEERSNGWSLSQRDSEGGWSPWSGGVQWVLA